MRIDETNGMPCCLQETMSTIWCKVHACETNGLQHMCCWKYLHPCNSPHIWGLHVCSCRIDSGSWTVWMHCESYYWDPCTWQANAIFICSPWLWTYCNKTVPYKITDHTLVVTWMLQNNFPFWFCLYIYSPSFGGSDINTFFHTTLFLSSNAPAQ